MKIGTTVLIIGLLSAIAGVSPGTAGPPTAPEDYFGLFEEIVKIVEENFYDPKPITRDFPAIEESYRRQLTRIGTRREFSALVNAMLARLNASHTYYLTPEDYEYYQLAALFSKIPEIGALFPEQQVVYPTVGILTQAIEKRVHIVSVLPGGIGEKAGLRKGDEIVSANGKPFSPIASLLSFVEKEVSFEIRRRKDAEPFTLVMKPVLANPKQEFLEAQRASVRVFERSKARIGYIHLYSYAGNEYHEELIHALAWGALKGADALVIDLRYGLGGAWPYYLNLFNPNIPVLTLRGRDGRQHRVDSQWRKPAAYLVNGFTRSGKELLAFGARKYALATVIGERTPGRTRGGRLFPLSNRDLLFLAVQRCAIDGVDLEGAGVAPDIEVPFDLRYCAGKDAQLEAAIEHLSGRLR